MDESAESLEPHNIGVRDAAPPVGRDIQQEHRVSANGPERIIERFMVQSIRLPEYGGRCACGCSVPELPKLLQAKAAGVALLEPCGRMKVALGSHGGGFGVAIAWLATRFEVALMSH